MEREGMMAMSSSEESSAAEESWIEWFCKQEGHEFLCEIDRRYIGTYFFVCWCFR